MRIRLAEREDFERIAAIVNEFILHTAVHFSSTPESAESMRSMWEGTKTFHPWYVAVDDDHAGGADGRVVGYAKSGRWRDRTAYDWSAELGVYMDADYRGRGVGRALYNSVIDTVRRQGYRTLVGGMTLPNEASRRLHESLGFVHVGTVHRAGWKLGQWWDVGFWELHVGEGAPGAIRPVREVVA